jgi:hypothetical protein
MMARGKPLRAFVVDTRQARGELPAISNLYQLSKV